MVSNLMLKSVQVSLLPMVRGDGDRFTVAEVGASIPITESFSAKAKFEHKWGEDDARDWKFEVGTKYKF